MEQTILTLLLKVNRHLENIETQVYKQNDRISSLEKMMKFAQCSSKDVGTDNGRETRQGKRDNFINQMKAELENVEQRIPGEQRTRSKVRKVASLKEKSVTKPVRKGRSPHTVPSDKDEERRLRSFRRECLSKAIQWNLIDLLSVSTEKHDIVFRKQLSREEMKFVKEGRDRRDHLRRFLCLLKKKEFSVMQECLNQFGFDEKVVSKVWGTFTEFSDINVNRSRMKCFRCRLIENVSVMDIVDYLYSAEILTSEQLYLKITSSERPIGAQEELWRLVLQECAKHECQDVVIVAIKVALVDKMNSVGDKESQVYKSLVCDIHDTLAQDLLVCNCAERCSKSFHPVSCLKTMSMAGVYFSPPTERKRENLSTSGEDPLSSSSCSSSAETIGRSNSENNVETGGEILSADEETFVKTSAVASSESTRPNAKGENFLFQTQSARSRSVRKKKSEQRMEKFQSDSSLENQDGPKKNAVQIRNTCNYKATSNFSQKLENKPNVIRANNVYFDTGPKYYQLSKGRSSESSSEH